MIYPIFRCTAATVLTLTDIAHASLTLYSNSGSIAVKEASTSPPDLNVA
ncbi:MAG: hypothetical protein KDN05_13095 [Verrucomicrobiae bacterium]|nr:hypothetical protein [Verrucomicrobiae bacterium]